MSAAEESSPPPARRARTRRAPAARPRRDSARASAGPDRRRWIVGIVLAATALLVLFSVFTWSPLDEGAWTHGRPTHNWIGPAGHGLGWILFHAAGVSAWGVALALVTAAVLAATPLGLRFAPLATFGWVLLGTTTSALAHLLCDPAHWSWPPGGILGSAVGDAARGVFSVAGSLIVLGALLLMALLLATHFAAARAFEFAARGVGKVSVVAAKTAYAAWDRNRQTRRPRVPAERKGKHADKESTEKQDESDLLESDEDARFPIVGEIELEDEGPGDEPSPEPSPAKKLAIVPAPAPEPANGDSAAVELKKVPEAKPEAHGPAIIEPKPPPKPTALPKQEQFSFAEGHTGFHAPLVDEILEPVPQEARKIDRPALTATAEKLRRKLLDMGIEGAVTEIRPGPVVTMFEFKPAAGIKLSRIASLSDDLAMAMEALRVRIVAPIPGKGVVGFEVPNRTREMVHLRDVVEQDAFQKAAGRLAMAVGKDIEGMPYVADLARMPHLLIAGTTGSGKSVGVNSMLVSMLMRATPEELRFVMVDPKMLELSVYEGIPHLLLPVVTDPKKAALALRWAVEEMERRYETLALAGVRNIAQYNRHVEKQLADLAKAAESAPADAPEAEGPGEGGSAPEEPKKPTKLPFIVIVIDELADLMMVAAKEVEVYIARLAQMARAAGIHLVVATQRPSTDVLTGVIKANFPARISFQVASRHDSGTIINQPGAENLLGQGDMLILPPGTSSLVRVHGAFVSEAEIGKLTSFWKTQGAPVYDPDILAPRDEGGEGAEDEGPSDELYDQAIACVSEMRQVSISLLQRKMRIGYNRAARIIERMERDGIVGPADGAKPRDVLIRPVGEMSDA